MADPTQRSFVIRYVTRPRAEEVRKFYARNLTGHLKPRDEDEVARLIGQGRFFEVVESGSIVGGCYFSHDELNSEESKAEPAEFGGLLVDDVCRGLGVGDALGVVVISVGMALTTPPCLIAHVHEKNRLPRNLLTERLGFQPDTQFRKEIPHNEAPPSMERNAAGFVVGDGFRFQPRKLAEFADWIDKFDGTIVGKSGKSSALEIDVPYFGMPDARPDFVSTLRTKALDRLSSQ